MPSIKADITGKDYWRSLNELADTEEFQEFVRREFPQNADELIGENRRQFMKVMAASFALAGLTSCRWPEEKIVAYANRPNNRIPGKPVYFATSIEKAGIATGLLVKSIDGRPIKVEGNPDHPNALGGANPQVLASILEMYDPDRSQAIVYKEGNQRIIKDWGQYSDFVAEKSSSLRSSQGGGLRILCEATDSPTINRLQNQLSEEYPQAKWFEYEPINDDNERQGTHMVFGQPYRPHPDFKTAKVIVSLDNDFLSSHPSALAYAREWAERRDPEGEFVNRLYVIEGMFTNTGAMADHRLAMSSGEIEGFAASLAAHLFESDAFNYSQAESSLPSLFSDIDAVIGDKDFMKALIGDLAEHAGESVILAGPRQPATVHALAHVLNYALGNIGKTINYTAAPKPLKKSSHESLAELAGEMDAGEVDTLLILGGNPVYDAPADVDFAAALGNVSNTIHLSLYLNETSLECAWHVPRAHAYESWGDAASYDGTITAAQPLIAPLYNGKTSAELLSMWLEDEPVRAYDIVRKTFEMSHPGSEELDWRRFLHDGYEAGSGAERRANTISIQGVREALSALQTHSVPTPEALELVLYEDPKVYDGRYANNGWLQETPDYLTKLTWDNALLVSPSTADALDLIHENLVKITVGERSIEAPVYIMPGIANNTAALALGYGRTQAGRIGEGVGVNAYGLRTTGSGDILSGITLEKTGRNYPLSSTQDHHAIDEIGMKERSYRAGKLIQEGDLEKYKKEPAFAKEYGDNYPKHDLWEPHEYDGHKWGMTIDLNKCIGCNGCVTACQAENNIPIVGKEQVGWGREMHWIRVDRYFKGDDSETPTVAPQPMTCLHCENAPCEQVCPVQATVHSEEGLNVMVYNRCVGTRYCANNCPVKVRRFNFFNFNYDLDEVEKLSKNPEVTVRMRGVMEKCTFCTQRIEAVKIDAKNKRRAIQDGEIVTACQQACPTKAISFGDLNDSNSQVKAKSEDPRAYSILDVLYLKPRLLYLAKIRNPHPALAKGDEGYKEDHGHSSHS